MNPLDSEEPLGPFFNNTSMNTYQRQKIWKMAKINNFDEANEESFTVEEKLCCCSWAFVQRKSNVKNLHYNWIVTRQLAVRPPCTGSLAHTKVKRMWILRLQFLFCGRLWSFTHGHHCNSTADIFEIQRIRMASSQAWNLCGVNERERRWCQIRYRKTASMSAIWFDRDWLAWPGRTRARPRTRARSLSSLGLAAVYV